MMSRLPENASYWENLTNRLVAAASGQLREYRIVGSSLGHVLAHFSTHLGIAAAAAVISALLWLPSPVHNTPESFSQGNVYGFTPTDPLAALFVTSAAAPTMVTLLSTPTLERP